MMLLGLGSTCSDPHCLEDCSTSCPPGKVWAYGKSACVPLCPIGSCHDAKGDCTAIPGHSIAPVLDTTSTTQATSTPWYFRWYTFALAGIVAVYLVRRRKKGSPS